jgi:HSP20 family protein
MANTTDERKDVASRESSEVSKQEPETVLRPPVDIFEDAHGITLVADLPGVGKDRLNLQVDKDALIIEGDARIEMPDGMEAIYADVRSTRYRRSFTLSGELSTEEINANLKDGVLTVNIPKRAEVRPRKIDVHVE